jgi:hypothetical protein
VELRELIWRSGNAAKLAAHSISQREVREIVAVDRWVTTTHANYPDQVRIIGPTRAGRLLTIALEPTEDSTAWRPVTGWPATDEEIAYHFEQTAWMR